MKISEYHNLLSNLLYTANENHNSLDIIIEAGVLFHNSKVGQKILICYHDEKNITMNQSKNYYALVTSKKMDDSKQLQTILLNNILSPLYCIKLPEPRVFLQKLVASNLVTNLIIQTKYKKDLEKFFKQLR